MPISKKIGVTRLADITDMDVLRIPNYSAVVLVLKTISGSIVEKAQQSHAMASALMESIERCSSLPSGWLGKFVRSSYSELSKTHKVLHPDKIVEPMRFVYHTNMMMDWLPGHDLVSDEEIMVPASIALFRYTPPPPAINPFSYFHTNGLASGNVMEEAICHALCEVIERDAMSLADLRASAIPFHILRTIVHSLNAQHFQCRPFLADRFVDDPSIFPDVDIQEINFEPVKSLVEKFRQAGISLMVKNITSRYWYSNI